MAGATTRTLLPFVAVSGYRGGGAGELCGLTVVGCALVCPRLPVTALFPWFGVAATAGSHNLIEHPFTPAT
jgi:hypothetical protein